MPENNFISQIKDFAIKNSAIGDIHGFPHIERVYNMSVRIGGVLNANLLVLKIAALFHDIGRIKEKEYANNKNHAEISAEMATNFFKSNNFNLSQDDFDNIIHSIKAHSFSNVVKPRTIEAKILSDADKLDALGAIGLYRTISFTSINKGGIKQVIRHLETKIMNLKDQLYLEISKEIAKKRQKIIIDFYNEIEEEDITELHKFYE